MSEQPENQGQACEASRVAELAERVLVLERSTRDAQRAARRHRTAAWLLGGVAVLAGSINIGWAEPKNDDGNATAKTLVAEKLVLKSADGAAAVELSVARRGDQASLTFADAAGKPRARLSWALTPAAAKDRFTAINLSLLGIDGRVVQSLPLD